MVLHAGKGAVYSYDAIGSHERSGYAVQGSGKDLIQPVLDNQLKAASPLVLPPEVLSSASFSAVLEVFVPEHALLLVYVVESKCVLLLRAELDELPASGPGGGPGQGCLCVSWGA